jgi:O-acetyl-ADP-ribose deacetylase (regulator of RNase III)
MHIYLRDLYPLLVDAWARYFQDIPDVTPSRGDIFDLKADVIISPANSFGFMDGGIDRIYSLRFGWHVQERLQALLRDEYGGQLPVGMAVMLETRNPDIPYLISAPTMHAPNDVSETQNAYLAFRAALRLVEQKNAQQPGTIKSILCPGLATATGRMPFNACARQMYTAYMQVLGGQPWQPKSINEVINEHYRLIRPND